MMRYFNLLFCFLIYTFSVGQTLEEKIKQRVEFGETPGIVVGIFENGKTNYYAFGVANLETQEPVTSKTLFEIGSITKTFTASMAALLSERKQINFSDPAQKYLPANMILPQYNGKAITIEHLATAHSGLPRMPLNFRPQDTANPYIDYREDDLAYFISKFELSRDPGSEYEYSNLGMGLLGYILTRVTSKPYSKLVEELVTKPLGMNSTFISGMRHAKPLASGYADKLPMKAWTWNDESVMAGAGGLVSNAEDMMKYLEAQLNPSAPMAAAFALTHQPKLKAGTMKIGYGWHVRDDQVIWHNGGTGGFRSFAGFDPSKNKAVVVLTNSTSGADDLGFHLLNDQYSLKELKKPVVVESQVLREYVGNYEVNAGFAITVTLENEGLCIQATGQPRVNIYPESESRFYLKAVNAQIEFKRNTTTQRVDQLVLYQNGAEIVGKKID
jgi:D-alanyl-D-alanine-carboxypeptidase/D-alanyl-D-alanine-endopeptidase